MDEPITPERHRELRRAATHQAGMILVTALRAGWDPDHYFPDEAERDLVLEEVERIAGELLARALVGSRRPCSVCGFPYVVRRGGVVGRLLHRRAVSRRRGAAAQYLTAGVAEPRALMV